MGINRPKILFILPSLKAGGAERVMSFIASNINKEKLECELLVLGFAKDAVYDVGDIKVFYLNKKRLIKAIIPLFFFIRINKANIVVGSIAHINRILSIFRIFFRKIKFVGRSANVDGVVSKYSNKGRIQYWKLYKYFHKNLDKVICQSNDMANNLIAKYRTPSNKIAVINNPITDSFELKSPIRTRETKTIQYITVGALHSRKGHLRIVEILSKLDHSFNYTIIGSGQELEMVFDKIKNLGLENSISHIPYTKLVAKELSKHDVFLNGSFVEGFPNSFIESCAVGTPVITFNIPGGINEIISQGINGFIVETIDEYVNHLNQINKNNPFKPEKVRESVTSKYSKDIIISKYEALFFDLMDN